MTLDPNETNRVLEILENCKDEEKAVQLLKDFNSCTSKLGKLVMNQDSTLDNDSWKKACDQAKKDVDSILNEIYSLEG